MPKAFRVGAITKLTSSSCARREAAGLEGRPPPPSSRTACRDLSAVALAKAEAASRDPGPSVRLAARSAAPCARQARQAAFSRSIS